MHIVRFLDRGLFRLVSILAQLLIVSSVAAAFYQVLARFVLQSPADWSEAWSRASLIWAVLLGVALAFRQGAMLSVEMLRSRLRGASQRVLEFFIMATCALFMGFLAWIGGSMAWRVRFQTMPSLEVSISWVYLAIPVGATLAIVAILARWLEGSGEAPLDESNAL
ncbi:TRAP transporter small permease [Paracandidimonas soli]|uniref:TRAP transporter small permease protein n=1 Tax=Paracandidimonas soli TaxID=1917182 RepID=A0A4R3VEM2_9BURK|nr:TRAP transporter small permease [Paracandidimonas soli]TCV02651.1 TRAP-type C4-dicarboxylate transport system permease small subunit [Paracandidimonas soli]